jgi:DNA-binding MarR family transcriptional regulator
LLAVSRTLTGITELPVIAQPPRRSGALLDLLSRRMWAVGHAALDSTGLRPRHLLALTVLRDQGESGQADLAGTLQLDRTNLVGLLNELEGQGLVARTRSAEDRRRHVVELTEAGRARLGEAEAALAQVEDEVLGALDGEQRLALYELLQRATSGHVVDCAAAAAEPASPGDC